MLLVRMRSPVTAYRLVALICLIHTPCAISVAFLGFPITPNLHILSASPFLCARLLRLLRGLIGLHRDRLRLASPSRFFGGGGNETTGQQHCCCYRNDTHAFLLHSDETLTTHLSFGSLISRWFRCR